MRRSWCEALSCISLIWRALRMKIGISTLCVTSGISNLISEIVSEWLLKMITCHFTLHHEVHFCISKALKSMRNAVSWDENMHSWKFTRKYNAVIMVQIWFNDNCELVEQVKMLQIGVLSFQNECTMPSEMWRAADNWLKSNVSAPFVILDVSPVG